MALEKLDASVGSFVKDRFGSYEKATSVNSVLTNDIPFMKGRRLGNEYVHPVKLQHSHGITIAGGANVGTAFDLNDPVSMVFQQSRVEGSEILEQSDLAYGMMSSARENGEAAFGNILNEAIIGCREAVQLYTEIMHLYGGENIGVVSGTPTGSGTSRTVTITVADWAPGIWAQFENARVDVYDTTGATKRNTNADLVVGAVDFDQATRTVVLTGDATDVAAIADTDIIVPKGHQGQWATGLATLAAGTGTVQGIVSGTYSLWNGNSYANGSAKLSMTGIQSILTQAMVRGLKKDVTALVNPYSWSDINNDLSALRRYVSETKNEMSLGTSGSIKFFGVTGASVELKPHPYLKAGDAFIYPKSDLMRIGSTDVTSRFDIEGEPGPDNFYQHLEGKAGVRFRCYTHQGLAAKKRNCLGRITGIVPTGF